MNIAEIRQKYPQYNDMPDDQLAQALHGKYYQDIPFDQFAATIGLTEKQPIPGDDKGAITSAVQGFNSVVPFGNRLTAGAAALVNAPFTDLTVSELYDTARANQIATEQASPTANLAGMGAGVLATLPFGMAKTAATTPVIGTAANALNKASTATANFVRGGAVAKDAGLAARAGNLALQSAKGAAVAAPTAALYQYGASDKEGIANPERITEALEAGRMGAAVGGALPVAGAALGAIAPVADDGLREVGKLAKKYNIPLSLDQITGSRALKTFQKTSQDLPFSGQQGFRETQMKAYNKALFKTVGMDADRFTPETMNKAFKKVGGEFDLVTKGKQFNIGGSLIDDLAATADEVASTYGQDAAAIFQKEAARVINDFSQGDVITGELISRQRARVNALARKASDPNIKGALLDLENNIVDAITSKDPQVTKMLATAKQRYKNLIVLEPIATKAKGGNISPSLLNNRVAQVYKRAHTVGESGEIGELARVGYELLPELGGSDTAQKMFFMGAALPTGVIAPTTTAATIGANRAFQSGVNRNQALVSRALGQSGAPSAIALPAAVATPQMTIQQQKAALRAKKSKP